LVNTYTSVEDRGEEAVPGIYGSLLCVVIVKEVNDVGV